MARVSYPAHDGPLWTKAACEPIQAVSQLNPRLNVFLITYCRPDLRESLKACKNPVGPPGPLHPQYRRHFVMMAHRFGVVSRNPCLYGVSAGQSAV